MKSAVATLTEKIIAGFRLGREDDLHILLESPLEELMEGAGRLQKHFCGNHVDLCTIINGRSGRCSENCRYCAQAACHNTGIEEYPFLPKEEIIANARANEAAGVNRFAIVTSGRLALPAIITTSRLLSGSSRKSAPATLMRIASRPSGLLRKRACASAPAASSAWERLGMTGWIWP